ncbi:hypothetical protein QQS21_000920 [Conoideocrella luteorostrata]|uniref:Mating-type switching protein swi10 n=1 Tax=Conoideocrella luteorostrata TaxID=1105319 RepID=A0AAJ0G3P8_9HYPO|nr:hypothetical protein QQS21_000920 [Conoideocrella luteorostrata]
MSVQIPVSPISSADSVSSPISTTSRGSRRSLIIMANNLKPTRQKLQKYFSKSRHSAPESDFKDWDADDLSSVIKMASMQMGSLGNPEVPISPVVQDTRYKPALVRMDTEQRRQLEPEPTPKTESFDFESLLTPPRIAAPRPPQRSPPPMPIPVRLPPPPPIAELPADVMSMETDPSGPRVRRGPSQIKPRPVSAIRRRAKTPVHKIGQLEMAAAKQRQEAAINRQATVRTIARQYRALIYEDDVPAVPRIPSIHRKPLPATAAPHLHEFDNNYGPIPRQSLNEPRGAGLLESPRPRYELAPSSPVMSDTATLVSFRDETTYLKPLMFPSPPTPPASEDDCYENDTFVQSPDTDTLRFQIGFELLTRELSSAFADHSARTSRDASGLQIWVMIEAYERLRNQVSAMASQDPELKHAAAMFDSWLTALRAIRRSMADEAADSESEYGDDE